MMLLWQPLPLGLPTKSLGDTEYWTPEKVKYTCEAVSHGTMYTSPLCELPGIKACRVIASDGGIKMYEVPVSIIAVLPVKLAPFPSTPASSAAICQL